MFATSLHAVRKGCFATAFVICIASPAAAQPPDGAPRLIHGPASRPLHLIPPLMPPQDHHEIPLRLVPPGDTGQPQPDTALQTTILPSAPNLGYKFPGVGAGDYGYQVTSAPPDTNGDVGSTQYVQWVNTSFAVFNKADGTLLYGPAAGNTLWADLANDPDLGPCATTNDGDPIVQYDQLAGRWVMSQISFNSGTGYYVCIAVSQSDQAVSAGALGAWNRYAVIWDSTLPDYAKMSVWPNAYLLTANMYVKLGLFGWFFSGGQACALDRSVFIANGSPTATTLQCTQAMSSYPSLLAADLEGSTLPPDPSTGFLMNLGSNALNFWKFKVDFNNSSNTILTGPSSIPVTAFSQACNACITQKNTTQKLDSLGDRLMFRLAYRNLGSYQSMVLNHSVNVGSRKSTHAGVRWYELRFNTSGTPVVYQQGTFSPDANHRWMGSVAMDKVGNIAVGYSVSGSTMYPAIRYTGRQTTDPTGTLQSEVSVVEGSGSQGPNLSRWGDYTRMSVDPVDDCTFWYTNEYLKSSGTFNWSTEITRFKFPSCSAP